MYLFFGLRGVGIVNTQCDIKKIIAWVISHWYQGKYVINKSYHITNHGIFFLSHVYHPIPVFVDFILQRTWRYTMWYRKIITCMMYEWYHIDIKDWLIIYCFTSRSRIFHLYEGLQNLGLCLVLRAFEKGGIFIVPHLLRHGASVFPVSSKGLPHSVASYNTQGMWRIYSNPDPHASWY
jgi:hypothetical protein